MDKIEIFGINFNNLSLEEATEAIRGFVVLSYSEFIVRAQKDDEFRKILNSADFCLCESRGLYLTARFLGKKIKKNIYGVDLIENLNKKAKANKQKLFLYGGREEVVKKTAEKLGDTIIGFEHGYQREEGVIDKINLLKPDILLVGLGSPKQERFIFKNLKNMPSIKLAIGVGGAFDFISGHTMRAPKLIQKIGMEWIWRIIINPSRVKRVFTGVGGLLILTIKEIFKT